MPQSSFSFYADPSAASQNCADKKHDFFYFSVIDGRGLVVDFYVAMKTMVSYSSNLGKKPCCGSGSTCFWASRIRIY
jgi:hypothetical protein